jgi:hypothetical protein
MPTTLGDTTVIPRAEVEGMEFEGLRSHIQKFLEEVETIHEQEFA